MHAVADWWGLKRPLERRWSVSRRFDIERFDYFGYERGLEIGRGCVSTIAAYRENVDCCESVIIILLFRCVCIRLFTKVVQCIYKVRVIDKKAQLSLTNPRDAKACQNCSNSTCLLRCRWQYWPIFIRLAVVASEICEIPRNSLKIQTYGVQGHPRSSCQRVTSY